MLTIQNDSGSITFDSHNYVLTSIDYGSIGATHSTAKGAEQVGERVINTTLDTRDVEIVGFIRAASAAEMETKKAALYRLCEPRGEFQILLDNNLGLSCHADGTVKFAASKLTNNDRVAQFVIDAICYDPLFSDAVARYRRIAEWVSNFIWPLEIPETGFTFADRTEGYITLLQNNGDVETGLLIHFTASASVKNPMLMNVETREFIALNRTLGAGETVVVNTNYGAESVTSYIGDAIEDIINDLDLDSTFLQAPVGTTSFHFSADENVDSMTVTVYYYQKYLGV